MDVDHIAFVTDEIERVTDSLPGFCNLLPIEEHPIEGTREQYIEIAGDMAPMLLLIQPIADGPYRRALDKRGIGLHHIGGTTPSIKRLLPTIEESRLLLHPISLNTLDRNQIWLCRPGVPFLVELVESTRAAASNTWGVLSIPTRLSIPSFVSSLFNNLVLQSSDDGRFHIHIEDSVVTIHTDD